MSRVPCNITEHICIIMGSDYTLGRFIDVTDSRYANSGKDLQGEGYVMEWSKVFGLSTNRIDIQEKDIMNKQVIILKCDEFINKLNQRN